MSDRFAEIPARIERTLAVLSLMIDRLDTFESDIVPKIGRTETSVLIPIQILENAYTAIETLFMRISQSFENHLDQERWHSDLLEKMSLYIKNARPGVISEATSRNLGELLRFRHFKRYYFELDYDWRKVDLLIRIFRETVPLLAADLSAFSSKLSEALS